MNRYRNRNPYWLSARFASRCECGAAIPRGARILYHPGPRIAQCEACGRQHEAQVAAEDMDIQTLWGGQGYHD